ncbi:MAG: FecR domain-containing protein [Acidobacteria bacterium]|nr:FecR domain-containing protein [Acidobacteriota bacterium]
MSQERQGILLPSFLGILLAVFVLLCPAAKAQLGGDTAVLAQLSGQVSAERAGELWVLTAGQTLQAGEVVVTGPDGYAVLELPDQSKIEVFPNSRFAFRTNRFNWRDLLDLYLGKVRLSIQRLTHEDRSLRVTSPTAVISVRGTVFEVEVGSDQQTRVSVESGSVRVRHRLLPGREVTVEEGQSLEVFANIPLAAVKGTTPLVIVGRIGRLAVETAARVEQMSGKSGGQTSGGPGAGTPSSSPPPSASDTGSNEPAPPPDEDRTTAPPGDVVP